MSSLSVFGRLKDTLLSLDDNVHSMQEKCTYVRRIHDVTALVSDNGIGGGCGEKLVDFEEGEHTIVMVKVFVSESSHDVWRRMFDRHTRTAQEVENILKDTQFSQQIVPDATNVAERIIAERDRIMADPHTIDSRDFFSQSTFQQQHVMSEICQRIVDGRVEAYRVEDTHKCQDIWASVVMSQDSTGFAMVLGVMFPECMRYVQVRDNVERIVKDVILVDDFKVSIARVKTVNVGMTNTRLTDLYNMEASLRRVVAIVTMMYRGPSAFRWVYSWYAANMQNEEEDPETVVESDFVNVQNLAVKCNDMVCEPVVTRVYNLLDTFGYDL